MSMQITFEISDHDLQHFRDVMQRVGEKTTNLSEDEIVSEARKVLTQVGEGDKLDFITERIGQLSHLIEMLECKCWALEEPERSQVLKALAYFSDPEDIIPDDIPGLGFLDDAIMIELICRELQDEIEAYKDFNVFVENEARTRGLQREELGRVDWAEGRRKELHSRMRNERRTRRSRRGGRIGGAGSGSGFSLF